MRLTKGHTALSQVVRQIGGGDEWVTGCRGHALCPPLRAGQHGGHERQPVVHDSSSATKPNSAVDHNTSSSAHLDRCMAKIESAARCSTMKSRSLTASRLLAVTPEKPRSCAA